MPEPALSLKRIKEESGKPRLVFVIPQKQFPKSVMRNKIKRRLRVILNPVLKKREGSYTVFARRGAEALSFSELKHEINEILKNSK